MPMTYHEARDATVQWLRDGGTPNETLPFHYNFLAHKARIGACAGAAIAYLAGLTDCDEAGKRFFGLSEKFYAVPDKALTREGMADWLEQQEPTQ